MAGGGGAELDRFVASAGRALADAQRQLASGADGPGLPSMAIDEVELDLKITLDASESGMELKPVSSKEAGEGSMSGELISSLRVRFVAQPEIGPAPPVTPERTAEEVMDEVRKFPEIEALGEVDLDATFEPDIRSWLVRVMDRTGKLLREVVVPDRLERRGDG